MATASQITKVIKDNWFGALFMLSGLVVQYITFVVTDCDLLSFISGSAGVISVVLCSQKRFLFYAFGWIQLITYCILAYNQRLYGELAENGFYAIMMIWGTYIWSKHYNVNALEVKVRKLSTEMLLLVIAGMLAAISLLTWILMFTDDTQPLMDSVTTVPAFIAQILLTFRYRENWLFWFIIDVGSIIMWIIAGDWCMATQFIFWTLNCIYGYYKWSEKS